MIPGVPCVGVSKSTHRLNGALCVTSGSCSCLQTGKSFDFDRIVALVRFPLPLPLAGPLRMAKAVPFPPFPCSCSWCNWKCIHGPKANQSWSPKWERTSSEPQDSSACPIGVLLLQGSRSLKCLAALRLSPPSGPNHPML